MPAHFRLVAFFIAYLIISAKVEMKLRHKYGITGDQVRAALVGRSILASEVVVDQLGQQIIRSLVRIDEGQDLHFVLFAEDSRQGTWRLASANLRFPYRK